MALHISQTDILQEVNEKPIKFEEDIQKVFESNLCSIMGLEFLKSEFAIKNERISRLERKEYEFDKQSTSAIERMIERYQVYLHHKNDNINNPNDWTKEIGRFRYRLDLILRIMNESVPPLASLIIYQK